MEKQTTICNFSCPDFLSDADIKDAANIHYVKILDIDQHSIYDRKDITLEIDTRVLAQQAYHFGKNIGHKIQKFFDERNKLKEKKKSRLKK